MAYFRFRPMIYWGVSYSRYRFFRFVIDAYEINQTRTCRLEKGIS